MALKLVHFLAILFTVLTFAPTAAHLFSLANKMGMSQADYFTAQLAYRRWDIFGWAYLGALAATLTLAVMLRGGGGAFWLIGAAFLFVALALAIFVIWVLPGNRATENWIIAPANWETLRRNWEYGHAASAAANFLALCMTAAAATLARPDP